MARIPRISDAEWEVMNVVWDTNPIAAQDVVERLAAKPWSPRTVKTMLGRLVKKGALAAAQDGNRYLYLPRVERAPCVRSEARSFMKRVFAGDPTSLLVHFVQEQQLTAEEIAALRQLLADKTL